MADIIENGARILGSHRFNVQKHGWPMNRYIRWGTLLDCRGKLRIHPTARFGYDVKILTASHVYSEEGMGRRLLRTVLIDEHAWVGTGALLYNCHVEEHAIVGAGAVVKNAVVPAWSIVEGNPAVIVGRYDEQLERYKKFPFHVEAMEKF